MNDKEYKKLKLKIEQKYVEMNELGIILFKETGKSYIPQLYLGSVIPKCPECGEEMDHIEPGTWRCYCEGWE